MVLLFEFVQSISIKTSVISGEILYTESVHCAFSSNWFGRKRFSNPKGGDHEKVADDNRMSLAKEQVEITGYPLQGIFYPHGYIDADSG
jgi:hypothetical protein